jgi:hypothetical protein
MRYFYLLAGWLRAGVGLWTVGVRAFCGTVRCRRYSEARSFIRRTMIDVRGPRLVEEGSVRPDGASRQESARPASDVPFVPFRKASGPVHPQARDIVARRAWAILGKSALDPVSEDLAEPPGAYNPFTPSNAIGLTESRLMGRRAVSSPARMSAAARLPKLVTDRARRRTAIGRLMRQSAAVSVIGITLIPLLSPSARRKARCRRSIGSCRSQIKSVDPRGLEQRTGRIPDALGHRCRALNQ